MSHGTVVINSVYREEWYQQFYTCMKCKTEFMCDYPNVKYCPGCGRKIVGEKRENETIYYFKETSHDECR